MYKYRPDNSLTEHSIKITDVNTRFLTKCALHVFLIQAKELTPWSCVSQHQSQLHHRTPPPLLLSKTKHESDKIMTFHFPRTILETKQLTPVKCSAESQSGFASIIL